MMFLNFGVKKNHLQIVENNWWKQSQVKVNEFWFDSKNNCLENETTEFYSWESFINFCKKNNDLFVVIKRDIKDDNFEDFVYWGINLEDNRKLELIDQKNDIMIYTFACLLD